MSEYNPVKGDAINVVCRNFEKFIDELIEDGRLSEIRRYIPDYKYHNNYTWNIEKAKIVFELLRLSNHDEAEKILSYLKCSEYGWQGGDYRLSNHCPVMDRHCKFNYEIENTPEATRDAFMEIEVIFRYKKYGSITSYLFGYCLAALFSSKLKRDDFCMPYFLQIACGRNSNMYRLIHEIVDICDVSTDLFEHCDLRFGDRYCDHDHVTIFPTQSAEKAIGDMMCNRDIPIVIDGYENERFYSTLLREAANIPGRRRKLDSKDKFNVLPIFICHTIKSQLRNVFSMDLTDLDVDDDYMGLIQDNKQRLASWAFELIKRADEYFPKDDQSFLKVISAYTDKIRAEYRHYTNLSQNDVNNIGLLTFFLSRYMNVFKNSIRLNDETEFEYRGVTAVQNRTRLIGEIKKNIVKSLFDLHNDYSPTLPLTVNIDTNSSNEEESKRIKNKGEKYVKNIIKYYQSYSVSIGISDAEFKNGKYVFSVKLMPGTDGKLINRHADDVRRLLELEFFTTYIDNSTIKIVASEKPLKENSLIKILESPEFRESKMEIPYAVGYDIMGEMVIADIVKFPHLLIGGASGSGKSSALHSLVMSIVYKQPPSKVKLLILDFGASGLNMFNQVPHMLTPVVTEIEKGWQCILILREIMEDRLKILNSIDPRDRNSQFKKWPFIICIIDEFPNFIMELSAGKNNKMSYMLLMDLLARARKVKIYLVLAAQDASRGNISIKNTNIRAGIAFQCTTWRESKDIIGVPGAENLFGEGSLYFKCPELEGIKRAQGSYMSPEEIMDTLNNMEFDYDDTEWQYDALDFELKTLAEINSIESGSDGLILEDTPEKKLAEIIMWTLKQDEISNKKIMDEYGMGYVKANVFLKDLETFKLVTKLKKGSKRPRNVIPKRMEDIPVNVKDYLKEYGYTESDIKEALNKTKSSVEIE